MRKLCEFLKKNNATIIVISFVLLAVYAICMATPTAYLRYYGNLDTFYQPIQGLNDAFIFLAIGGIVLGLLYNLFRNNIRKIFYISNFVWFGLFLALDLATVIVVIAGVAKYQGLYSGLDFAAINSYFESMKLPYFVDPNTPVFLLGYLTAVVILLNGCATGLILFDQLKNRKAMLEAIANDTVEEVK